MTSDTSLNSYCTGGINYENLPENFDLTKEWIVYSFNKTSQISCLGSKASVTNYNITAKILSTNTVTIETINDYLVNYLNGNSYNGIQDILFTGDNHTLDMEKGVYVNSLQFDALFS
jgi:hypothetical protein